MASTSMRTPTRLLQNFSSVAAECSCRCGSTLPARRWNSTQAEKVVEGGETAAAGTEAVTPIAQSYPFSDSVIFPETSIAPKEAGQAYSVMDRVNQALLLPSTSNFRGLFRKGSSARIPPGSIISVETHSGGATPATSNSTSAFAGVLMAVKRRHWGVDDAFTVRANVGKPGVGTEIRFDVNSPWIKDIKVLRRDDSKRRGKLYYIRRSDKFLSGVQGAIRNAQAQTAAAAVAAGETPAAPKLPTGKKGKKGKKGGKK